MTTIFANDKDERWELWVAVPNGTVMLGYCRYDAPADARHWFFQQAKLTQRFGPRLSVIQVQQESG